MRPGSCLSWSVPGDFLARPGRDGDEHARASRPMRLRAFILRHFESSLWWEDGVLLLGDQGLVPRTTAASFTTGMA